MTADPFLRISILGTVRNADLVVPADQPATALLPQLLGLLGEGHGQQGTYTLTTALGEPVNLQLPMGQLGLEDGTVLRLSRETQAPPVPVISDLVDATAEHETTGRWTETSRGWVLGACSALMMLTTLIILLLGRGSDALEIGLAAGALHVISMLCRILRKDLAWTYFAAASVLGLWWTWQQYLAGWSPLVILLVWLAIQLITLTVHTQQRFAHLAGLMVLAIAAGSWWLIHNVVDDSVQAGAVTATLALLLLGLTPRLALTVAGVFKADDAVGRGANLALSEVVGRLERAHQVLSVAIALLAMLWALGMSSVAGAVTRNTWVLGMTVALTVAWTLRGRHFPLATERAAIYGASLVAVGIIVWSQQYLIWIPLAAVALAMGLAIVPFVRVSDLAGAQLRRIATWLETFAVIATIPVLVGMFDLYTQLLESFK